MLIPTWLWLVALGICGVFTTVLGTVHFWFPVLLDFRLGPIRVATKRSDVHGIAWVMNHAASYTLVSIGIVDLLAVYWINSPIQWMVALWIAIWWFIRAASQLYLGRRPGDWWILVGFAWLGVVHVGVALFI